MPGFRPAVEELQRKYLRLTHDLGHLVCESLGVDPQRFDEYFDFHDPDLAASLNLNLGLDAVAPKLRAKVRAEFAKPRSALTGQHIDGPPFLALLVNDRPGLEVVADENRWIPAPVTCRTAEGRYPCPVVPGSVIVNSGGTLMHLSRGRIGATLHRVNVDLVPPGETRVSLPFFLLPRMEGPLEPFPLPAVRDTGYKASRDRGTNAAVNRMGTFPQCTRVWWRQEFKELRAAQAAEVRAETGAAHDLAARRAAKSSRL